MQNVKTKVFSFRCKRVSTDSGFANHEKKNETGTTKGSQLAQHTQGFRIPDDGMLSASSSPGRTPYEKEEGTYFTFKNFKGDQSDKVHIARAFALPFRVLSRKKKRQILHDQKLFEAIVFNAIKNNESVS